MYIHIDESSRVFTLNTKHTSYQLRITPDGFVHHVYYGPPIGNFPMAYSEFTAQFGFSPNPISHHEKRDYSVNDAAQEYPGCGCGDFRFGIGGTVTFKKSGVAEIVRTMPLDRIVLETDCPYLTPAPYRGQRNESAYVRLICDKIAELKGLAAETVAAATTANAEALFGIRYTEKNTERR